MSSYRFCGKKRFVFMSNEQKKDPPGAELDVRKSERDRDAVPKTGSQEESAPGKELTPEEQMALYEKDLKENDWGHQPC
jgi:hypothetical protein